jgi:hypothetical protein
LIFSWLVALFGQSSGRSAAWFSALAWGASGRPFKSARPDFVFRVVTAMMGLLVVICSLKARRKGTINFNRGGYMRQKIIIIVLTIVFAISSLMAASNTLAQQLPPFKVVGKDKSAISILVPPQTTQGQLKALIYEFRNARKENTLSKMKPAITTARGNYRIVWIFVFSEPSWASIDKLKKFISVSLLSPSDIEFSKEYSQHIRAEYYYAYGTEEYGTIGYKDDITSTCTKDYKKLF